ncbi:MAG TPA: hypothetical protein VEJ88_03570 [Dissulfurispiraceae bacterium]|nr:hypothetical protein [Dissulfurispiraceae bacterium]
MINNFKTDRTIETGFKKKAHGAQIKGLADAILLQSLEDLWIDEERSNCIDFFSGEGFRICSDVAGMSSDDKVKILNMVGEIIDQNAVKHKKVREIRPKAMPNLRHPSFFD